MDYFGNGEQGSELLEAQANVWNHTFNFINSMSLKCAIQLGIPDIIQSHGQPMTLSKLIAALPIHPSKADCVYRLMRILVHSGFFARRKVNENGEEEEEGYVPTQSSQLLLKDNPLSGMPFSLAMLDPMLMNPWHYLSTWLQNDDPTTTPFGMAHGRTIWDFGGHEPKFNNLFNEAMSSDARLVSSLLISQCKGVFEGLKSLVDVGGGTGTLAKPIANAFPHLDCTVFDLPHVVADLKGSDNLKYVGGDMFVEIPPADAILLKWIIHDYSDEESIKLLKRCKEAITSKNNKGGKVIIVDMVMESQKGDKESIKTQLFFDVMMMVLVWGRERNEKEWAKLFTDAGFSGYKITPVLGLRSIIEVYP